MKRLLNLIFIFLALFTLIGCGGELQREENETAEPLASLVSAPTEGLPEVSESLPTSTPKVDELPITDINPNRCANNWPELIGPPPGHLQWSPDEEYIAIQSWIDSRDIIHIYQVSDVIRGIGKDELNIFASIEADSFDWAPNSNELIITREGDIYKTSLEGEPVLFLETRQDRINLIHWMPTGQITFKGSLPNEVLMVNQNGDYIDGYWPHLSGLDWSPDGNRIAYSQFRYHNSDIRVIRSDGELSVWLTEDPGCDENPVWSPDGRQIAFTSTRNELAEPPYSEPKLDIYVVDGEGGEENLVTSNGYINAHHAWSPDSQKIAYVHYNYEADNINFENFFPGQQDIYIVDVNTGRTEVLTGEPNNDVELYPMWSPNGEYIAYFTYSIEYLNANRRWQFQIAIRKADGSGPIYFISNPSSFSTPE